MTNYWAAISKI